jgi:hypothetical protein
VIHAADLLVHIDVRDDVRDPCPERSPAELGRDGSCCGSADSVIYRVASLSIDGREIKDVSALTMPNRLDGAEVGGVVGFEVMIGRLAVLQGLPEKVLQRGSLICRFSKAPG